MYIYHLVRSFNIFLFTLSTTAFDTWKWRHQRKGLFNINIEAIDSIFVLWILILEAMIVHYFLIEFDIIVNDDCVRSGSI